MHLFGCGDIISSMEMRENKECVKYFLIAGVILMCLYSSVISKVFIPLFDNVYYGNLVKLFLSISNAVIWGVEMAIIIVVCKKIGVKIFAPKSETERPFWRVIAVFVMAVVPMFVISACVGWKVKIVYSLGLHITSVGLACNAAEIGAYIIRMGLMVMFISCVQSGFELLIKSKVVIPWGAIFAFLTFGLIDFFVFAVDLRVFYLLMSFWYGLVYLFADRKIALTWMVCYLIYLL